MTNYTPSTVYLSKKDRVKLTEIKKKMLVPIGNNSELIRHAINELYKAICEN